MDAEAKGAILEEEGQGSDPEAVEDWAHTGFDAAQGMEAVRQATECSMVDLDTACVAGRDAEVAGMAVPIVAAAGREDSLDKVVAVEVQASLELGSRSKKTFSGWGTAPLGVAYDAASLEAAVEWVLVVLAGLACSHDAVVVQIQAFEVRAVAVFD